MQSQEWAELVEQGFEAVKEGDLDLFDEMSTPDLVMTQPPEVPDAKTYEGQDAVRKSLEDWPAQWEDFRMDLLEVVGLDDDVALSVTRHRGRGRGSGIEMDFEVFYVHWGREGKLARLEMFFNREQALKAAARS
jgi:ketosteroid isomerase-like protein